MALEQPGAGEQFAAQGALVPRLVGEQVHGQGRHGHVDTVAEGALGKRKIIIFFSFLQFQ